MITSIKLSAIAVISAISIVGCGSSSSSDVKTGVGYYVDSAVQGIDYVCGSKTGKTDSKGAFTFEEGKECAFTLAGIPLRTTQADELKDGKEVFEGNPKVAKLLQSIDADNNLSNGIQITDAVLTALTDALKAKNSTGVLPEGPVLTDVVASVGNDVDGVDGNVRTDEQVQEHLTQTQTEITKQLLAGKTFYFVSDVMIESNAVNADVTSLTWKNIEGKGDDNQVLGSSGTVSIQEIVGNQVIFSDGGSFHIINTNDTQFITQDDNSGEQRKYYLDYNDAKAQYDSLEGQNGGGTSEGGGTPPSTLSDKIVGKTYYIAARDSYVDDNGTTVNNDHVEKLVFDTSGKLYDTWTENDTQQEAIMNYSINDEILSIVTQNDGTVTFTYEGESSTYISFTHADGSEGGRFFFTYSDAEKSIN